MNLLCKAFYREDILEIEHELLDECTTIQKIEDADAQRLNAIMTGVKLMADRILEQIRKEEEE